MLTKIQQLKAAIDEGGYEVDIEVDGGIKADWTLSQCAAAGANCFIAGSGVCISNLERRMRCIARSCVGGTSRESHDKSIGTFLFLSKLSLKRGIKLSIGFNFSVFFEMLTFSI